MCYLLSGASTMLNAPLFQRATRWGVEQLHEFKQDTNLLLQAVRHGCIKHESYGKARLSCHIAEQACQVQVLYSQ
jgi:hypothetical protein